MRDSDFASADLIKQPLTGRTGTYRFP